MAQATSWIKTALFALATGGTIAGLVNVYGDSAAVQQQAERVACGGSRCSAHVTRVSRTAIGQTYEFQTDQRQASHAVVECRRAWWLIGEYTCVRQP